MSGFCTIERRLKIMRYLSNDGTMCDYG